MSIDPYIIGRQLGVGPFGTVFAARDSRTQRDVAIKIMNIHALDQRVQMQYIETMRKVACLKHEHLLPIIDVGIHADSLYLVTPLVTGGNLRAMHQRYNYERIPLDLGLGLVIQAVEGLVYAHEQGVIHRNIKAENLELDIAEADATSAVHPTLKLSGFGVAALTDTSRLSASARHIGMHSAIAPEQCSGGHVDGRSDLYALGAVLYEITTGRQPFIADTPTVLIYHILLTTPPSPRSLNPVLSPAIEAIIMRCLARNPNNRYQTARALLDDLRAVAKDIHRT